jgi:hypothetical protein
MLPRFFLIADGVRHDFPIPTVDTASPTGMEIWRASITIPLGHFLLFLAKDEGPVPFRLCISRHATLTGTNHDGSTLVASHPECFAGVEVEVDLEDGAYFLVPGLLYNGNLGLPIKDIPVLAPGGVFETPLAGSSWPGIFILDGQGSALVLDAGPAGASGGGGVNLTLDTAGRRLRAAIVMPAMEERQYRHCSFQEDPRLGIPLGDGEALRFRYSLERQPCVSISELFGLLRQRTSLYRQQPRLSRHQEGNLNRSGTGVNALLAETAGLVSARFIEAHYKELPGGGTVFLNAFDEEGPLSWGHPSFPAECLLQTGWCNGSLTAYPLIALGEPYRTPAIRYLDFMATRGVSPSGLAWGIFDGQHFFSHGPNGVDSDEAKWTHLRPSCDFITYTLRAVRVEQARGYEYPLWLDVARQGLDALCQLWDGAEDFGRLVDREGPVPTITEAGSAAGAFAILALAEGCLSFPGQPRLIEVLRAAGEVYWKRCIAQGRSGGGALDILGADDSESAAAFAEGFLALYRLDKDTLWLDRARTAADVFSSWVSAGLAFMPPGSSTEFIAPRGGVLANVQNRHLGPGICVNSGRFLRELAIATGDADYARLADDIVSFAVDCVSRYDGDLYGYWRGGGMTRPFRRGMMSEQINLTDSLNLPGETWGMSFSWPMSALLLSWVEGEGGRGGWVPACSTGRGDPSGCTAR